MMMMLQICMVLVLLLISCFVFNVLVFFVIVNDVECVYEYVFYEGDIVFGNFVVVDYDIFWSFDYFGIDFIVCFCF